MADSARTKPLQLGTYHMANDNSFEPQRVNNFEVQITGLTGDQSQIITLSVASYSAPTIERAVIDVNYGNNLIHFAGKPTFSNSNITLNDYIGKEVEKILSDWQKLSYDYNTQKIGWASDYKKIGYLIEYDPSGGSPRQWMLVGCWLSSLQLGDFNQNGNEVRQVTCTLVYDYAIPA